MKNRIIAGALAGLSAIGLTVALAAPSQAVGNQFGCSTANGYLHMTATLLNYGSAVGTGIYASATTNKTVPVTGPDLTYKFVKFTSSSGLQTRTTQPTQWGSASNPLNFNTKYVTVTWKGYLLGGLQPTEIYKSCTTKVGY